jgi:hypothetical protein
MVITTDGAVRIHISPVGGAGSTATSVPSTASSPTSGKESDVIHYSNSITAVALPYEYFLGCKLLIILIHTYYYYYYVHKLKITINRIKYHSWKNWLKMEAMDIQNLQLDCHSSISSGND